MRWEKTQGEIFCTEVEVYEIYIPPLYHYLHSWAHWIDGSTWVINNPIKIDIVHIETVVQLEQLLHDTAAVSKYYDWGLLNNIVDTNIDWIVYNVECWNQCIQEKR